MQTALPEEEKASASLANLLHPDPLENGELPESRVVYSGISWERYLEIDRALGDDRSDPRLFYFNGELEIVTASNEHDWMPSLEELLNPDLLVDGYLPEQRVVHGGISWDRYLAIDQALGDERSGPRLYYLDGELEIVTASNTHEHIKGLVEFFVEEHFFREKISHIRRGMATLRLKNVVGAEPDASWCIRGEKEFPDVVVEVALSSGGVRKLGIYAQLHIPEVWIWRKGALSFYVLRDDQTHYDRHDSSLLVPGLDLALLYRCVPIRDWMEMRQVIRNGLGT